MSESLPSEESGWLEGIDMQPSIGRLSADEALRQLKNGLDALTQALAGADERVIEDCEERLNALMAARPELRDYIVSED